MATRIKDIIEKKKNGIECTEEEIIEVKDWLKELKLPSEQPMVADIQLLFPKEYGEYLIETVL